MNIRHALGAGLAALTLSAMPLARTAQAADFPVPNKPLRLVVGFPAGGGTDLQARTVAQYLSPILGIPVIRPKNHEATIYGAMLLAGLSSGVYGSLQDLSNMWAVDRIFEPEMSRDEADGLYAGWVAARELTKGWTKKLPQH